MSKKTCRYTDDIQTAKQTTTQVLQRLNELNVPSTPVHFTLLYEMVSQTDPEFAEELANLIRQHDYTDESVRPLFRELLKRIINQHLPTDEVSQLINEVLGHLESWSTESAKHQQGLTDNIACLEASQSYDEIMHCLNQNILPPIRKISENTLSLQQQMIDSTQIIKKLKRELEHVTTLAKTDSLTGIPNRRGFDELCEEHIKLAQKEGSTLCMVLLDLDHFKKINDTYGHLVGDSVLRYIARTLHAETKGQDAIARLGGEEFVILLSDISYQNAHNVSEKIRKRIATKVLIVKGHNMPLQFTSSFGVALYRAGESADQLFERADRALYLAKQNGRNQTCGEHQL
ncbi:MAG: diguanylate cyclase [Thiomicrospira sp.]|uniref:GGDEF domain-containing protein n=1 Tax=Thiomicrospira sp. TaxID=935 RepID=UPI0019E60977|nr:GGDEF domain-containing protein [Thiomicrospira sp.]MBE0493671.1 diguanylate cyclase [Thiomicrospira sp.]